MFNLKTWAEWVINSSALFDMEGKPVKLERGKEYQLVATFGEGEQEFTTTYVHPALKGYLANGLFGLGDRMVNEIIAKDLREALTGLELYVPQENPAINDKTAYADSKTIAEADTEALLKSDFLVAVIDGVEIDSGVAAEIGLFASTGKPIYALFTDVRQQGVDNLDKILALFLDATENQFVYRNLFVVGLIKKSNGGLYSSVDKLVEAIKEKHDG